MATISIITVVRNDLTGLKATRESIASQTFQDFDWIVIDGASTDGTAQYALALSGSTVQVRSERDSGIFDAMNKGLDMARGKFVVFLNAGDVFASDDTLAGQAPIMESGEADLLYGDSLERHGGNHLVYKAARSHAALPYGMFCCHQTIFYRRSTIADLRYNRNLRIAGDYEFTARFLLRTSRIERVPAAICIFDLAGVSNRLQDVGRKENWMIQKEVLNLSLARRLAIRATYILASFVRQHLPHAYRLIRFKTYHD